MTERMTGEHVLAQLKEQGTGDNKLLAIREKLAGQKCTVQSVVDAANQLGFSSTAKKAIALAEASGVVVNSPAQLAAEAETLRETNRRLLLENEQLKNRLDAAEKAAKK